MYTLQMGVVISELSSSWSDMKRLAPDPFLVSVCLSSTGTSCTKLVYKAQTKQGFLSDCHYSHTCISLFDGR